MKQSAGLLLYRGNPDNYEVLLVHPGGPYWAKKDAGVWSIPKGEFGQDEDPLTAVKREFSEETGQPAPAGKFIDLGQAKQSGGKVVFAWAIQADIDASTVRSNTLTIEWPPRSNSQLEIPEVDRAGWFTFDVAVTRIVKGQVPLLESLAVRLGTALPESNSTNSSGNGTHPVQTLLF